VTGKRREVPAEPRFPDLEIGASAKMRSIRFEVVPETEISFPDSDPRGSGSYTARENLPEEVEPGVVYRDAKVRWHAQATSRAEIPAESEDGETQ
jgi:hypothetical protein